MVTLKVLVRNRHIDAEFRCADANSLRYTASHGASGASCKDLVQPTALARLPVSRALEWSRGLVEPGQPAREPSQRSHNARGGYNKAPVHLAGIGCPATGGTSLASPWPPFYLFISLGGGEPNDDKIC